jgi:CubicO group peptidase (beta-lactamase class C family)
MKNISLKRIIFSLFVLTCLCMIGTLLSCKHESRSDVPFVEIQNPENESDVRLISALKAFIPYVVKDRGTPGLTIALSRREKIIWEAGFGYADLEERTPMTPQIVCHSGSMGKVYTATAIMQLVEKGVLGLDEPINIYLKDFQITNPLGDREIMVKDLLTHSAGLLSNVAHPDFMPPKPLGEHLKFWYSQKKFQPYSETLLPLWGAKVGKVFQYSNMGMATLGYLVEVTNPEGLSFSDYVQQHIMNPLGMSSSQFPPVQDAEHVRPDIFERFPTGYTRWGAVDIPTPAIYFADYPAGTVVTTPEDHIKLWSLHVIDRENILITDFIAT